MSYSFAGPETSTDNRVRCPCAPIGSKGSPCRLGKNGNWFLGAISTSTWIVLPYEKAPITCVAQRSGPLNQRRSLPSPPRRITPNHVGSEESHAKCTLPFFISSTLVAIGITRNAMCLSVTAKSCSIPTYGTLIQVLQSSFPL